MTIYIHFLGPDRVTRKLHNVLSIEDQGNSSVLVKNQFAGDPQTFVNVASVACTPDRAAVEDLRLSLEPDPRD